MTSNRQQHVSSLLEEISSALVERGGQRVDVIELTSYELVARVDGRRVRVWTQPSDHYDGESTVLLNTGSNSNTDVPVLPAADPTPMIVNAICGYLNVHPPPGSIYTPSSTFQTRPNPNNGGPLRRKAGRAGRTSHR